MKKLILISVLLFSFNGWAEEEVVNQVSSGCVDGNCSNGKGTYIWSNGDSYTGEWKDNLMHGKGVSTWSDGSKYSGEYRNHKRHGKGDFAYGNGDHYIGDFINDMRNGQGTYTWADGRVREGMWRDSVFVEKNNDKQKIQTIRAGVYVYKGNDIEECKAASWYMANGNVADYQESLKVCNRLSRKKKNNDKQNIQTIRAGVYVYKGNDYEECKAASWYMANGNEADYQESLKVCNRLSKKKKNTFGDMLIEAVAEGLVDGLVEKAIGCDEDVRVRHRTRSHPLGERNETIVYKEDC